MENENKTKESNQFTGNKIGTEGAKALSEGLKDNKTLKKLVIGGEDRGNDNI